MVNSRSKYMKIKLKVAKGEHIKVGDENDYLATPVTPAELDQIYQNPEVKQVARILYVKSDMEECLYYVTEVGAVKICS